MLMLITVLLTIVVDPGLLDRAETRVTYVAPVGITGFEERGGHALAWSSTGLDRDGKPPADWRSMLQARAVARIQAERPDAIMESASDESSELELRFGIGEDRCWVVAGRPLMAEAEPVPSMEEITLAVLPFRVLDPGLPAGTGQHATLIMISMINAPNVTLVEREEVARLIEARQFTELDLTEDDAGVEAGRLMNARLLLMGTVGRSTQGEWIVTGRLIDTITGEISDDHRATVVQPAASGSLVQSLRELTVAMRLRGPRDQPASPLRAPPTAVAGTVEAMLRTVPSSRHGRLSLSLQPNRSIYEAGESVVLTISSDTPGHLTILQVGAEGEIVSLVPNPRIPSITMEAGETLTIPSADMGFRFLVQPPYGPSRIHAFLTSSPLIIPGVFDDRRAEVLRFLRGESLPVPGRDADSDDRWLRAERDLITRDVGR